MQPMIDVAKKADATRRAIAAISESLRVRVSISICLLQLFTPFGVPLASVTAQKIPQAPRRGRFLRLVRRPRRCIAIPGAFRRQAYGACQECASLEKQRIARD